MGAAPTDTQVQPGQEDHSDHLEEDKDDSQEAVGLPDRLAALWPRDKLSEAEEEEDNTSQTEDEGAVSEEG